MTTLAPGTQLGEYRIEREIARGGMGVVYKATRTRTGQAIALKVIAPERAADPSYRDRFVREANVLVGLQHPRIVPLVDWGDVEGTLYLALAYLDGPNLEDLIEREGPFSLSRTIEYLAPVAEALDAAHRRGYVHRDVKPANIMLDADGNVYLTDFGLGKLAASSGMTQTNTAVGTLAYMSPEQFTGKLSDPSLAGRTDTYALGCVLHACLTRQEIVPTDNFARAMHAVVEEPPPRLSAIRPSLPADLDAVQAKVLAKDPVDRYETAAAYIAAVRAVLIANPKSALAGTVPVPSRPAQRQRIDEVAAIGMAGAGLPSPPGARTVVEGPPLPPTVEMPAWGAAAGAAPNRPRATAVNWIGLVMVVGGLAALALIGGLMLVGGGLNPGPSPVAVITAPPTHQITPPPPSPTPTPSPRPVTPPPAVGAPDDPASLEGTWPTEESVTRTWLKAEIADDCLTGTDSAIDGSASELQCPLDATTDFKNTGISIAFYFFATEREARLAYEQILDNRSLAYNSGSPCPEENSEGTWTTKDVTRGRLVCLKVEDQVQYIQTYFGKPIVSLFYMTDSTFKTLDAAWVDHFAGLIPDPARARPS